MAHSRTDLAAAAPITLRELYGIAHAIRSFAAARTALVLVDYPREFFAGPRWARSNGMLVVSVRNESLRADSPVFAPASPMTSFVDELAPAAGDVVVTKHQAGAFTKTELDGTLRTRGIDTLIVAGIMTHLAVDSTARDGTVLGYRVVVAADACATRRLPSPSGGSLPASDVQRAALAPIGDRFADVLDVAAINRTPVTP